jgi:hypothetical protein
MAHTLVQHSGCGYGGKQGFSRAVEIRQLSEKEEAAVLKAGGIVIPDRAMATELEHHVNYPPEVTGMYPRCRGTFSTKKVDQLKIYVPTEYCRGPLTVREVMES